MKRAAIRRPTLSTPREERGPSNTSSGASVATEKRQHHTPKQLLSSGASVKTANVDSATVSARKSTQKTTSSSSSSGTSVVSKTVAAKPQQAVTALDDGLQTKNAAPKQPLSSAASVTKNSGNSASVAARKSTKKATSHSSGASVVSKSAAAQPQQAVSAVDNWLQTNPSIGESTARVIVIRGEGKKNVGKEKKKGVWENIFGGRGGDSSGSAGQNEEEDLAPRRSAPRSVVAPEIVDLPPSPSKGGLSVVSSVTDGTFGTANHSLADTESVVSKPNFIHTPKRNLRKPGARVKRVSTAPNPSYMHPLNSSTSPMPLRSTRPQLGRNRGSHVDQFGRDDDDMSISSFSTGINSVDSKLFAPPAFRGQAMDSEQNKESAEKEDNSRLAEKWSLLGIMGGMNSNRMPSLVPQKDKRKSGSLTENLVDSGDDGIPSKVPSSDGLTSKLRHVLCNSSFLYAALFAGMATGLFYGLVSNSRLSYSLSDVDITIDWDEELNVAFIGNSYLFVNDIPRVMEAISDYHIHQESVLHSSGGSLGNLLLTGNGMYPRWRTGEAMIDKYVNEYGKNVTIYDYGLCTVAQILGGYDDILSYGNEDGAYYNDGKNPCIRNQNYFNYIDEKLENSTFVWDYVVLVDQTKRMAVEEARQQSIYALANAYGPLIQSSGAIPVIVDTHAFWSDNTNMTGLVDIPTFQALIYDGVLDYVSALAQVLPEWQAPVVAPVGLAFLVVYEENYYLWQKLFIDDDIHSSVHGSYLFACVLYATLYGHLPPRSSNSQLDSIFANSRLLVGQDIEYPSAQEAFYYRRVAKRVALDGYIPTSMSRR